MRHDLISLFARHRFDLVRLDQLLLIASLRDATRHFTKALYLVSRAQQHN